jgi:hypothetical protein
MDDFNDFGRFLARMFLLIITVAAVVWTVRLGLFLLAQW